MTTKEQERQAIAKIRRIVEGLGENSYVGTAMEGVLEVAEENIEYDAAFSLKGRAELAEKNEKEAKEKREKLEEQLKGEQQAVKELREQLTKAQYIVKKWNMPQQMRKKLEEIVSERVSEAERRMIDAANSMADGVGENGDVSNCMKEYATEYKRQRRECAECRELLRTLKKYEDKEGNENE